MIKYLFLICALFIPSISHAETNWPRIAANTSMMVDMAQTISIAKNKEYYETNWALGAQPSVSDVYSFFLTKLLLTNVAGEMMPKNYSNIFYMAITVNHTDAVFSNYMLGVRMRF